MFVSLLLFAEKAEKMGQSMTKVPYKETFWKGTMRTRPREYSCHKKKDSSYHIRTFGLIVQLLVLSGNGTLNKQAGIDYKQLSLLAKINENQSGEVSWTSALGQVSYIYYFSAPLMFNRPCALCAVMAGAVARGRDHCEGSAGERLDHQEEQRLQRGASETQVTHAPALWQWQSAAVGFHLAHLNRLCRLVNTALGRDWQVASCATRRGGFLISELKQTGFGRRGGGVVGSCDVKNKFHKPPSIVVNMNPIATWNLKYARTIEQAKRWYELVKTCSAEAPPPPPKGSQLSVNHCWHIYECFTSKRSDSGAGIYTETAYLGLMTQNTLQ